MEVKCFDSTCWAKDWVVEMLRSALEELAEVGNRTTRRAAMLVHWNLQVATEFEVPQVWIGKEPTVPRPLFGRMRNSVPRGFVRLIPPHRWSQQADRRFGRYIEPADRLYKGHGRPATELSGKVACNRQNIRLPDRRWLTAGNRLPEFVSNKFDRLSLQRSDNRL